VQLRLALRPRHALLLLLSLPLLVLAGCGESEETPLAPVTDNPFAAYAFGTDATFEAVTWNLHNFAQDSGSREIALAADAIRALDADVVALQEIASQLAFEQLMDALPGYTGHMATSNNFQDLAYVWQTGAVTPLSAPYEIYQGRRGPFPRTPLVLEVAWQDTSLLLINNHFKCCGDGTLDASDEDDEETRRYDACVLLDEWIVENAADRAVIVLGDLNDLLVEANPANNVFRPFLEQPQDYLFADLPLAEGSPEQWSWGPGQSHLDHLLITNELFVALQTGGSEVRTLRLDQALSGATFRDDLTDHAPVGLKLAF